MDGGGERHGGTRAAIAAEALLATALVAAPLMLGTVQFWSLAVLLALCAGAAVVAAFARARAPRWPFWIGALAVAVVALQAVPLPPWLFHALSPHAAELAAPALGGGGHAVSLDAPATARELARLVAYLCAFFAASRLAVDGRVVRRLGRVVAAGAALQIAIVAAHKTVATNLIYGMVPVTQGSTVLGSFGNANHLAAYLALGAPLAAASALQAPTVVARRLWAAVAAIAAALVVVTLSRTGVAGLVAGLVALVLLLGRRGQEHAPALRRWLGATAVVAVLGVVVAVALRGGHAVAKLSSMARPDRVVQETKVRTWLDLPAMLADFWRLGVGRGAFETIYPTYKHVADRLTFSHLECGPLQALADFGVPVGLLLIVAWLGGLKRAAADERVVTRAAVAALVGFSVHELADFAIDIGGVGVTVAVLFGIALPAGASLKWPSRWLRVAAAAAVAAAGGFALFVGWRGDLRRDVARLSELAGDDARAGEFEALAAEATRRHPVEPWLPLQMGQHHVRHRRPAAALPYLNRALELDPTAWKPHVFVGEALEQLGRRGQSLLELRLAWEMSQYNDYVLQVALRPRLSDADLLRFAGDDPARLDRLAGWLERKQRPAQAMALARHAVELKPDDAAARLLLARNAAAAGSARDVLAQLEKLPPGDPEVVLLRVAALDKLGRKVDADVALAEAFQQGHPPAIGFAVAERALAARDEQGALKTLEQVPAGALAPADLARLHRLRGLALERSGKPREGLDELATAARIDPSTANRMELGDAYARNGVVRAALLEYRTAARSTPSPPPELLERIRAIEAKSAGALNVSGGGGDGDDLSPEEEEGMAGE